MVRRNDKTTPSAYTTTEHSGSIMAQDREDAQKAEEESSNLSFEELLEELDGLVNELESGELSLENSLKTFERGMKLADQGTTILDDAEKKVEVLLQGSDGNSSRAPFQSGEFDS